MRELRQKQLKEKTRPGGLNAKFSAGALVDLEYDVQILQIMHGQQRPDLRTPRIHHALNALQAAGVLAPGEGERLASAYRFFAPFDQWLADDEGFGQGSVPASSGTRMNICIWRGVWGMNPSQG